MSVFWQGKRYKFLRCCSYYSSLMWNKSIFSLRRMKYYKLNSRLNERSEEGLLKLEVILLRPLSEIWRHLGEIKEIYRSYSHPENIMLTLLSKDKPCKLFPRWFKLWSSIWLHLFYFQSWKHQRENSWRSRCSFLRNFNFLIPSLKIFIPFSVILLHLTIESLFMTESREIYPAKLRMRVCAQVKFRKPSET